MTTASFAGIGPGLRFHQVLGDNMQPTIQPRDYVLVAPVHRYVGEGYYLIADPLHQGASVFSVSAAGTRAAPQIRLHSHLKFYSDHLVSTSYFEEHVLAQVVMIGNVVRPDLLQRVAELQEVRV